MTLSSCVNTEIKQNPHTKKPIKARHIALGNARAWVRHEYVGQLCDACSCAGITSCTLTVVIQAWE